MPILRNCTLRTEFIVHFYISINMATNTFVAARCLNLVNIDSYFLIHFLVELLSHMYSCVIMYKGRVKSVACGQSLTFYFWNFYFIYTGLVNKFCSNLLYVVLYVQIFYNQKLCSLPYILVQHKYLLKSRYCITIEVLCSPLSVNNREIVNVNVIRPRYSVINGGVNKLHSKCLQCVCCRITFGVIKHLCLNI